VRLIFSSGVEAARGAKDVSSTARRLYAAAKDEPHSSTAAVLKAPRATWMAAKGSRQAGKFFMLQGITCVGSGRIVASETEAPSMLANLV
jgi:hypothetical protein